MPKLILPDGRAFDAGLAAFAALSAGFVAFAMPDAVFTGLVQTSRLPDLVAAAQPPLGDTARFASISAAILFTFAAVWALMAALGSAPAPGEPVPQSEPEAPRLRRADAHPDAPPRPPLLARDLGEPLELDEIAAEAPLMEQPFAEADHCPLPGFLVPQEPEPVAEPEAEADFEASDAESEPAPELSPEAEAESLPIAELAARLPESDGEDEGDDTSLSQLVNRIEFGLSRKRQALPPVDLPPVDLPPAEEPAEEPERVGHRLRSAINDLQRIASSGT